MTYDGKKLGAFIVPTGIGASIGGYAGDASVYAKKFAQLGKLIVNPNVVNAGGFSGLSENMLYVEGYTLDEFFKGKVNLKESSNNKIGVIFDKSIPQDVLNIHLNTINAVKTVYGINVFEYVITRENVGIEFYIDESGISTGFVENIPTLEESAQYLIDKGCNAIGVVCFFDDSSDEKNENYQNGIGVDPVGGVEAIISHYISREFKVPCAHSPAFANYEISTQLVNPKSASEYITPTYLPCILIGLDRAPVIVSKGISVGNLDYLVVPADALGSIPVLESLKKSIPIYAIKENFTILNVTNESICSTCGINILDTYDECLELIKNGY